MAWLGCTELRLVDVNDSCVSVIYGRVAQTSITVVCKFPTKTWGAARVQQCISGSLLPNYQAPRNDATIYAGHFVKILFLSLSACGVL